jgi:transposase
MGLDCHRNFSRVSARDEQGRVVFRGRLEHGDRQELRRKLAGWPKVPVVLEGTFGWGWISDELNAAGQQAHLANSRKVAAWRDARGKAKSNKIDADLLGELWTEKEHWWEIWLAPDPVRDQREWLRYRMTLVRLQTGVKNRIHATLHRHGILHEFSDLFGKKGLAWLEQLSVDPAALRESARGTLSGYLRLLRQLRGQLADVTGELRRQVRRSATGELWRSLPGRRSLPGVSFILAYTILAETGRIERFKNGRHLCSYSLLAPMADDSGEEDGVPSRRAPGTRHPEVGVHPGGTQGRPQERFLQRDLPPPHRRRQT